MIWDFHDIPGFEWHYQFNWHTNEIKSLWRIILAKNGKKYTHKERILRPDNRACSVQAHLCKNSKVTLISLWRITLLITQWPKPDGMVCCHNDGNIWNNHPDNVRYDTHSGNMQDMIMHWRRISVTWRAVERSDGLKFNSIADALRYMWRNVRHTSGISWACQQWVHAHGYGWKYISQS